MFIYNEGVENGDSDSKHVRTIGEESEGLTSKINEVGSVT